MLLQVRHIGATCHQTYDGLEEFLTEVDRARPRRIFSHTEESSEGYELIAGFARNAEGRQGVHLYLSVDPLEEEPFRKEEAYFQSCLQQRRIPLLQGKVEVAGEGEILQLFGVETDWQKSKRENPESPPFFVRYGGRNYLAFKEEGFYSLTEWKQSLPSGERLEQLALHSDLGL